MRIAKCRRFPFRLMLGAPFAPRVRSGSGRRFQIPASASLVPSRPETPSCSARARCERALRPDGDPRPEPCALTDPCPAPVFDAVRRIGDDILTRDRTAPPEQRHTAPIFRRLVAAHNRARNYLPTRSRRAPADHCGPPPRATRRGGLTEFVRRSRTGTRDSTRRPAGSRNRSLGRFTRSIRSRVCRLDQTGRTRTSPAPDSR